MINLRPYQNEAIEAFQGGLDDWKRQMIVLPTGTGKTVMGLSLAKRMNARTLWIAHREELITQPIKALREVWPEVSAGVVKADRNEWGRDFVFASVQTAWRPQRLAKLGDFDLVVIDEAHHAAAKSYKTILNHLGCFNGGPPLLGLTATPERTDNFRLDDIFQRVAYTYELRRAVEDGYLVGVDCISRPIKVDLSKVGISGGDFKPGDLDAAMLETGIVEDVCAAVREHAVDRKTIIFTVSVNQAEQISNRLRELGIAADWVCGETPGPQRRQKLRDLASGKITHMVNCMVLTEGFDDPSVDCIVMARPTQSKSLYIQCVGRGLRIAPNKDSCLIIDMVGLGRRHSLIQAPVIFGIDAEIDDTKETGSSDVDQSDMFAQSRLMSQLRGVDAAARSHLRWVPVNDDTLALNCGAGGTVMMRRRGDGWQVDVVGRQGDDSTLLPLTMHPVDMELAQGISEDYVRRANAVYLTSKSARWRDAPASEKQKEALRKWGVKFRDTITKGEASDLMTQKSAGNWRNDPATAKQMRALRRRGVSFDERRLTKGEAGRLLRDSNG